ncbi:DUF4199 domain-containing protein [bacterium]|nr:DUF4199 domain-containing protein [bacterium]
MRKVTLVFGLIAGAIISIFMFVSWALLDKGTINFDSGEIAGYAIMVIALSMIFFGIKSYRDNYQNGAITFGKGLQVGLLITLVASLMYAVSWEIYYQSQPDDQPSFMETYTEHSIAKMKDNGASEAEIEQAVQDMANMVEMYKNPLVRFGITLVEILPVGVVISLISAGLLRKKSFLPA